MRFAVLGSLAISVAVFLTIMPVSAHHPIAAKFDPARAVTLRGSVTEVDWANPHVHVFMNVRDSSGVMNWAVELESPIDLQRSNWNRDTLKPGDTITVQGISARDGSRQAWGNSVVLDATGKRIFVLAGTQPPRDSQPRPTPRWPDGQPRLGPAPGERGYWGHPSSTALVQAGANVAMDGDGLLRNIADIDKWLMEKHGFALTPDDLRGIEYVARAFFSEGPDLRYSFPSPRRSQTCLRRPGLRKGLGPGARGTATPRHQLRDPQSLRLRLFRVRHQ